MGIIQKILGIVESTFQLGKGGPKLKNSTGIIQARNAADSAFAKMQVATPTSNDDAGNKSYVDNVTFSPNIFGLEISNNVTDANNDIDIAVGRARSNDDTISMILATALIKRLDATWVVGTNQGMLDTGVKTADTTYAIWLIERTDTSVVDILASLSFTAPTMPASYDKKRRIWAIDTDGSSNILSFDANGDYCALNSQYQFVADSAITNKAFVTVVAPVPPGAVVHIFANVLETGTTAAIMWLRKTGATLVLAAGTGLSQVDANKGFIYVVTSGLSATNEGHIETDDSSQFDYAGFEPSGTCTVTIKCVGWYDARRQQ
jgi:hypothetical protein